MADVFELKGTIKIEGAEEVAEKIQETADNVSSSTEEMADNVAASTARIEQDFSKMYTKMAVGGAAVITAIGAIGTKAASSADDIKDWSVKLGISTSAVQELGYIARQCDLDMSAMGMAVRQQNEVMVQAAAGNAAATESLQKLGLSYQQLQGMNPEQQFWAIAESISELGTAQERSAAATDIWGSRVGQSLLPMIAEGSVGIQQMRDRYAELGLEVSEDKLNALTNLDDSWKDFKATLGNFAMELGATVAPVVKTVFNDVLIPAFNMVKAVLDKIPGPIKTIGVGFIGVIATAALFIGTIGKISQMMTPFNSLMGAGKGALGSLATGFKDAGKAVLGFAGQLLQAAGKFAVYVARLIPVIVVQAWAMATNFPAGTAAFIGLLAMGGAAIYGIVRGIQALTGGGGEGGGEGGTPAGMDLSSATSEATALQSSEGAAVPEAASGGLFKGPEEGYLVKLHGTERVSKEEGGASASPAVNITITGNEISIPDETYLDKLADEISTRVAREWNRKLRYV